MSIGGLASAGAGIYSGIMTFMSKSKRSVGTFSVKCVLSEHHSDVLKITDHPVEFGAPISDHAFLMPRRVDIRLAHNDGLGTLLASLGKVGDAISGVGDKIGGGFGSAVSSAGGTIGSALGKAGDAINSTFGLSTENMEQYYKKFLALQASREPFSITTGKRLLTNMLIEEIDETTDDRTENLLLLTLRCREVIIVHTQSVQAPKQAQKAPANTAAPSNKGPVIMKPIKSTDSFANLSGQGIPTSQTSFQAQSAAQPSLAPTPSGPYGVARTASTPVSGPYSGQIIKSSPPSSATPFGATYSQVAGGK